MKNCVYLFPHSDFKYRHWAASLPEKLFISSNGPYWNLLLLILKLRVRHERIILFYRYLNVRKDLVREVAKLFIDLIIVFLALIRLIEIRWIIHNVDKESNMRFRFIVQLKRLMLKNVANYFYVTSDLIKVNFPYDEAKLRIVSFGEEYSSKTKEHGTKILVGLINDWRVNHKKSPKFIGIVTNWGNKEHESLRLVNLILQTNSNGLIGLVYLGKKTNVENEYFLEINERYDYFLKELNVDFVLKTLDDISVPFTLYSAATAGIPLMSSDNSYFSKDIIKYGLGGNIESADDVISIIENYDISMSTCFLKKHSWVEGAKSLVI